MTKSLKYKTLLTIAGSDSSGGAGIQADIKTASALGVYAMSVITAVTAQNTCGVRSFAATGADMTAAQLNAVLDDVMPDAVKIGMIPDVETVNVIADTLARRNVRNIVVDPVMVATSGDSLTADNVPGALTMRLFPLADVVTPNLPEACVIAGRDITADNPVDVARYIADTTGARAVLLKGGHSTGDVLNDVLYADGKVHVFTFDRINTPNTHGTGCTLSSAIAAFIARGHDTASAVRLACEWVHQAIVAGADYSFGHGHGPLNHLYNTHFDENFT